MGCLQHFRKSRCGQRGTVENVGDPAADMHLHQRISNPRFPREVEGWSKWSWKDSGVIGVLLS